MLIVATTVRMQALKLGLDGSIVCLLLYDTKPIPSACGQAELFHKNCHGALSSHVQKIYASYKKNGLGRGHPRRGSNSDTPRRYWWGSISGDDMILLGRPSCVQDLLLSCSRSLSKSALARSPSSACLTAEHARWSLRWHYGGVCRPG